MSVYLELDNEKVLFVVIGISIYPINPLGSVAGCDVKFRIIVEHESLFLSFIIMSKKWKISFCVEKLL